jgi:hypothetical protein
MFATSETHMIQKNHVEKHLSNSYNSSKTYVLASDDKAGFAKVHIWGLVRMDITMLRM